ncbi:MAG: hypothetical protein CVU43_21805 [Chloroflexi bacterium HGW-Chloroflexi-5]|jgi:hypothetical protein|nr:MAG: hypothetical protein CVU70_02340 [Deltaproteobacteria bacterium HGW-Deltaproteobacteria-5]PKN96227.1 MAG: hypothetical protein CVU43_21805 [Chloroflexi bacterium HGW-Chloroflexi-5]
MIKKTVLLSCAFFFVIHLMSCANHFGSAEITKPDEHKRIYEAKEKFILKGIAAVLKEKEIGSNVTIDRKNHRVDSDYVEVDEWRTKTSALVRRLNWKECEVTLIVTTEKKTSDGWEMRRLLTKKEYDNFFNFIELKIYEEMAKGE